MEFHRFPPAVPDGVGDERRIAAVQEAEEVGQGFGVFREAQQHQAAQDAGQAGVVVVFGSEPEPAAGLEVGSFLAVHVFAGPAQGDAVELQQPVQGAQDVPSQDGRSAELLEVRSGEERGVAVERAASREWKQPLDVVVSGFQTRVVPAQDMVKPAAGVIGSLAEIKSQQWGGIIRGVHVGHLY